MSSRSRPTDRLGPPGKAGQGQPDPAPPGTAELLLLPGGRILAHNLTPALAALLADLDPSDVAMAARAGAAAPRPPIRGLQNHAPEAMNNHPAAV